MRLNVKPLKNYQNINSFQTASEWNVMQGEATSIYLQIIDLDQDSLRYVTTSGALTVTFPAVNSANILVKTATLVDTKDTSIFKVDLSASEIPSTGNIQFSLTEGLVTKKFVLQQGIVVESLNQGGC